jgi:Tol biopolymer transport system component
LNLGPDDYEKAGTMRRWQLKLALSIAGVFIAAVGMGSKTGERDVVFRPGFVSTAAAEVRIAFRPDGRQIVWGSIGRDGNADAQDIWESHQQATGWSTPAKVSFDTAAVEFDPAFSPDGTKLYFQSDRPGGFGGADIYVVDVLADTYDFSKPRNLGAGINTKGDEWAPTPTPDGNLIFSSDGWGGMGKHDLWEASLATTSNVKHPQNLGPGVNGPDEDFDATLDWDGHSLLFSSGTMDDSEVNVHLYRSVHGAGGWGPRELLSVGCSSFLLGASIDPRDRSHVYYAANCPGGQGRMDIRQIDSSLVFRDVGHP